MNRPTGRQDVAQSQQVRRVADIAPPQPNGRQAGRSAVIARGTRMHPAKLVALLVLILLVAAAVGWYIASSVRSMPFVDSSKYQAVFFTNGQVYFGKLKAARGDYLELTDVFYMRPSAQGSDPETLNQAVEGQNNIPMIKLGEEVHAPEDRMVIAKEQVWFYENIKPDGDVAKYIEKYHASRQ